MWSSLMHPRFLKRLLFYLIAAAAYYYIIKRLIAFQYWEDFGHSIKLSPQLFYLGLVFIILWMCNLFFETKKWQILISPFQKLSFKDSLFQYFAGSFTAVGSPARLAEPGGRMLLLKKEIRINALLMTSIGGLIQNVVIGIAGLSAILLTGMPISWEEASGKGMIGYIVIVLVLVAVVILLSIFTQRLRYIWMQLKKVKLTLLITVTLLTFARYMIYNLQLYVVIRFFSGDLALNEFIFWSPVYFFMITIIPSFLLADIGIRGSVALLVFAQIGLEEPVLLTSVLSLWMFNVVLPAFIGGWILHRNKVLNKHKGLDLKKESV